MRSPFVDDAEVLDSFIPINFDMQSEYANPFKKADEYSVYEIENEQLFESNSNAPFFESELSDSELRRAIETNRINMDKYGWRKFGPELFKDFGITNSRDLISNLTELSKKVAEWQISKNAKNPDGIIGLNVWTYLQKKLGLHSLSNEYNIDVDKAIRLNNHYSYKWKRYTPDILKYFSEIGILKYDLPLNDEYFAYAIAKYQSKNDKIKKNEIDGILGPKSWDLLTTNIEPTNSKLDVDTHYRPGTKSNRLDAVKDYYSTQRTFSSLWINALVHIQEQITNDIQNQKIEFNVLKEGILSTFKGLVGAIPFAGSGLSEIISFGQKYYETNLANAEIELKKKQNTTLNDLILILKNSSIWSKSEEIIYHELLDEINYSKNKNAYDIFLNELQILKEITSDKGRKNIYIIALSKVIEIFSPHTRIYIHCRNESDFRNWSSTDISNLVNDSSRKKLNLRFTRVHPKVSLKENNISGSNFKILEALWGIFRKGNYSIKELLLKKDIFFSINFPLKVWQPINDFKYSIEYSFYINTLNGNEMWRPMNNILNLDNNVHKLPNNEIIYNDGTNFIQIKLTDLNRKGLVFQDMILDIVNTTMLNEYDKPVLSRNISLLTEETLLENENSLASPTNIRMSPSTISYFSPDNSLSKTKVNIEQVRKSGIPYENILKVLDVNLDIGFIASFLNEMNSRATGNKYSVDTTFKAVDSTFTEAIHQFQISNFIDSKEHDGILGQSTLETLGIFNHSLKSKINSSGLYGQSQLNRSDVRNEISRLTNGEFDYKNWYSGIIKPAWLGVKISDGIHILLYRKLKEAESWLSSQPQYAGMTPAKLGSALGFNANTKYSGARLSSGKQAMHGFGLALDINVSGNPWIGAGWVKNDPVYLRERTKMLSALKTASGQNLPGNNVFEYLNHISLSSNKDTRIAYSTLKSRNDEFVNYLKRNSSELSYWNKSQSFGTRNPLNGFLNLHADLVYSIRQIAGLAWGAIDFGPRASGDIMHFDLRTIGVGKFLCGKIKGYVPSSGHPFVNQEAFEEFINYEELESPLTFDEFHEAIEEGELEEDSVRVDNISDYHFSKEHFYESEDDFNYEMDNIKETEGDHYFESNDTNDLEYQFNEIEQDEMDWEENYEQEFENIQHDNEYYEDEIKDLNLAISANQRFAKSINWGVYYDQINNFLLPFSGQSNVSLSPQRFAEALSIWQSNNGLTNDGVLGPKTWKILSQHISQITPSIANPIISSTNAQQEWANFKEIRNRYPSWQMYDKVRNDVVSWGISNVGQYVNDAIIEWNANPNIKIYFGTKNNPRNFDGDHHNSYLNLRRLYNAKGIPNPANYFALNITSLIFFGRNTPCHVALKQKLMTAEQKLKSAGFNYSFNNAWSFVPRTFNANINKLSNHALGKAIDINYQQNPHIVDNREIIIIEKVCGNLLPDGFLKESNPDKFKVASDYFKRNFNQQWISQQTDSKILDALRSKKNTLNTYAQLGFFNLPSELVRELQRVGLSWGGSWKSAKDFMHFEIA